MTPPTTAWPPPHPVRGERARTGFRGGFEVAEKKVQWSRIRQAYVQGNVSYKELAKRHKVSESTLNKVAQKEKWYQQRKEWRKKVAAEVDARACTREADKLAAVTVAADKMGQTLEKIMGDERMLHMHMAVTRDMDGAEAIEEKELEMYNADTIRTLTKALKDMTDVLRNLYGIQTAGEKEAARIAAERLELEKAKAAKEDVDKEIVVKFAGDIGEAAE